MWALPISLSGIVRDELIHQWHILNHHNRIWYAYILSDACIQISMQLAVYKITHESAVANAYSVNFYISV